MNDTSSRSAKSTTSGQAGPPATAKPSDGISLKSAINQMTRTGRPIVRWIVYPRRLPPRIRATVIRSGLWFRFWELPRRIKHTFGYHTYIALEEYHEGMLWPTHRAKCWFCEDEITRP